MNAKSTVLNRRLMLAGATAAVAGLLVRPFGKASAAQKATLVAREVGQAPTDPEDSQWQAADVLEVPLAPQAVVKPRLYEAGVKAIKARALYDKERLAFLLEWSDPARELIIGGVDSFRDAVALEFPSDPASGIPYFGMGEENKPVTIYQWKADWQFSKGRDVDERFPNMAVDWYPFSGVGPREIPHVSDYGKEKSNKVFVSSWWAGSTLADPELQARTSVEKLHAEGFGTLRSLAPDKQDAVGNAAWKGGVWKAVISVPRLQEKFSFEQGKTLTVAFAAWDGAGRERGGEKAISTWYFLSLEQPTATLAYASPILIVIGAALVEVLALRMLRRKRGQTAEKSP